MDNYILQNITFPKYMICSRTDLYFKGNFNGNQLRLDEGNESITFANASKLNTNTYFNSISFKKWRKYTRVKDIFLTIDFKGSFTLRLYTAKRINNKTVLNLLVSESLSSETRTTHISAVPESVEPNIVFFELESGEKGSIFYGGSYSTRIAMPEAMAKLTLVMCTYKREKFVEKNLSVIQSQIICNRRHLIAGNLKVLVVDNGQTLDAESHGYKNTRIIPNRNTGGTGGFTRGLVEIMNSGSSDNDYVIFMDDDISFDPESLIRTYNLLTIIKPEFRDSFIGGSMLSLDDQTTLIETGAIWKHGIIHSGKRGMNLSRFKNVLRNDFEENVDYNAWWFCCFPLRLIDNDNLPLPMFIRGDDVEFGLRQSKPVILMNGICVWHEPFENKYSSWINYYMIRNQLVIDALHSDNTGKRKSDYDSFVLKKTPKYSFAGFLFARMTRDIIYYRYNDAALTLRGVRDYLKGYEFLMDTDPVYLHKEITKTSYVSKNLDDLNIKLNLNILRESHKVHDTGLNKVIRLLSLNGYLLPPGKSTVVSLQNPRPVNFFRAGSVLCYDEKIDKGFILKRSLLRMIKLYIGYLAVISSYTLKKRRLVKEYRENYRKLTSPEFWKRYLGIGDTDG